MIPVILMIKNFILMGRICSSTSSLMPTPTVFPLALMLALVLVYIYFYIYRILLLIRLLNKINVISFMFRGRRYCGSLRRSEAVCLWGWRVVGKYNIPQLSSTLRFESWLWMENIGRPLTGYRNHCLCIRHWGWVSKYYL